MKNKIIPFPVIFEGSEYCGIKNFDCVVVSLYTEPTKQGSFFTCIPISDKNYRQKNPTKAKVKIIKEKDWTIFKIWSDWGGFSEIRMHNSLKIEIDFAELKASEYNLL
jgi:hypothetical protein